MDFQQDHLIPGFVPSDNERVYRVLSGIVNASLATGPRFCEWGSGFGVVAGLASMLDFEAWGIEIEPLLIDASRQLIADFELDAEFIHGSFIPRGAESFLNTGDGYAWLTTVGGGTEQLGLALHDFSIIFAYPWPDEEHLTETLFEHYAAPDALLVTYHGGEDFRLRRKSGG